MERQGTVEAELLVRIPFSLQACETLKLPCRIQYLRTFIAMGVVDVQCKVIVTTRFCKIVTRIIQEGIDDIIQSGIVGIYVFIKPVESLIVS